MEPEMGVHGFEAVVNEPLFHYTVGGNDICGAVEAVHFSGYGYFTPATRAEVVHKCHGFGSPYPCCQAYKREVFFYGVLQYHHIVAAHGKCEFYNACQIQEKRGNLA